MNEEKTAAAVKRAKLAEEAKEARRLGLGGEGDKAADEIITHLQASLRVVLQDGDQASRRRDVVGDEVVLRVFDHVRDLGQQRHLRDLEAAAQPFEKPIGAKDHLADGELLGEALLLDRLVHQLLRGDVGVHVVEEKLHVGIALP